MNAPRFSSRSRQQGIVAVMAIIFLISAVIFALSQTLNITGSNSIDNKQQMDSEAAFFLAESGLERGTYVLKTSGTFTDSLCTGISGPYTLGRGSFTLSGTSTPATCDSGGAIACTSCLIKSVGTVNTASVNTASRTLTTSVNLQSANGKACNEATAGAGNCANPVMNLKNNNTYTSVAVFNLAYDRQGQSIFGACTGTGCALQWLVRAKQTSADMGNSVTIAAASSYPITTTLQSTNYSYVGALFPGSSSLGPAILGAYWDQPTAGGSGTVGKPNTPSGGTTNNGVTNYTVSSTTTAPVDANNTTQSSTKWCYGGDTLIFGFGGTGTSTSDTISNLVFNTAGTPAQNVPMTQVAKYPINGSADVPATQDIFAQILYARNPNLSDKADVTAGSFVVNEGYVIKTVGTTNFTLIGAASNTVNTAFIATGVGSGTGTATPLNPFAYNASSYKGNGTGAIGATFTASRSVTTLTVTAISGYPAQIISPTTAGYAGDTLGGSGVTAGTITVQQTSTEPGNALGGRGTYTTSSTQTRLSQTMTASSSILNVSQCTICFFASGDAISGLVANKTISSQLALRTGESTGGIGRYVLSSGGNPALPTIVASANTLRAGTPGATIYLPSTGSIPTVANTRVAIVSGTGVFAANTTATAAVVANAATNSFTVSPTPTTALNVATICGGTCAFFDAPSNAASTTAFTFSPTNADYWSSAFMCLKGVDITPPTPVTNPSAAISSWSEVVQ